jgi:hypothetical protein
MNLTLQTCSDELLSFELRRCEEIRDENERYIHLLQSELNRRALHTDSDEHFDTDLSPPHPPRPLMME